MEWLKKDNGYTLLEMILVSGLVGMLLLLLWTSYLSTYGTYIKTSRKVQNLEEARMAINFINDTFQRYEMKSCQVMVNEMIKELEDKEEGFVQQITFKNDGELMVIKYNKENQTMTFQTQEIGREITHFTVSRHGQLLDFNITVKKRGSGKDVVSDQIIKVGTTVSLQYK